MLRIGLLLALLSAAATPAMGQAGPLRRAYVGVLASPGGELGVAFPATGVSAGMGFSRQITETRSLRADVELMYFRVDKAVDDEGGAIGAGSMVHFITAMPLPPSSPLRPYVGIGAGLYVLSSSTGPAGGEKTSDFHFAVGGSAMIGWEWDLGRSIAFAEAALNVYAGDVDSFIPVRFGLRL